MAKAEKQVSIGKMKGGGKTGLSKKEPGFSAKVGKNHKKFGAEMSPAHLAK